MVFVYQTLQESTDGVASDPDHLNSLSFLSTQKIAIKIENFLFLMIDTFAQTGIVMMAIEVNPALDRYTRHPKIGCENLVA